MANELKIEEIVSDWKVNDLGSKNLQKIQKESDKSVKVIEKLERETKKADGLLSRFGKGFKGISAGTGAGAGAITAGVGSLAGGLGGLPIIGGLFAAVIASVNSIKNQFVSGLALKKELLGLSTDVQSLFGKKTKDALRVFDQSFSFEAQQLQLLSGLKGGGVQIDQLAPENLKILETFAKAQGKDLQNVFDGVIKSGQGLNDIQKIQAQQYIQLIKSQNPYEVRQGYDLLINLLKSANDELKIYAEKNKIVSTGVQEQIIKTKKMQQEQDLFAVKDRKTREESMKSFEASLESERLIKNMTATIAGSSTFVINKTAGVINKLFGDDNEETEEGKIEKRKQSQEAEIMRQQRRSGRANGGPVNAGQSYPVGEKGIELFTPNQSGRITPTHKMAGNTVINMRPVFNISGGNTSEVMNQVKDYLDNMARAMAYQTGGNVPQ